MNVLLWHVHGSWTTGFVQGRHHYVVPVLPDRGPDGRGRAQTWDWPDAVVERSPESLADEDVDVLVVQRERDLVLAERWLGGRRPGRDIPTVWLEHNAPQGRIEEMRHPAADRRDVVVVHVTHTNDLFWDCGTTRTVVIEHGIVDPGHRFVGTLPRAAVVVNEPGRRGRVVGSDLVDRFAEVAAIDRFGIGACNLPQAELHAELGLRRAYLHPVRWTSLGLSLVEAMHLGMPVVALSTTEVPEVVPDGAGVVSNRLPVLEDAVRRFVHDVDEAREVGLRARAAALRRWNLARFLDDWDGVLAEVAA